jgi:hypothetical protein
MKCLASFDPSVDRLHKLIRIAVEDIKKAEASPDTLIDMGMWYNTISDEAYSASRDRAKKPNASCVVCLAGAVMRFTIGIEPSWRYGDSPSDFHARDKIDERTADMLQSVNYIRIARIYDAYKVFYDKRDVPDSLVDANNVIKRYLADRSEDEVLAENGRYEEDGMVASYRTGRPGTNAAFFEEIEFIRATLEKFDL